LEAQHQSADSAACGLANAASPPSTNGKPDHSNALWQMTLFGVEEHPLLEEIRVANLDDMRPVEALELLHSWQRRLATEQATSER
jgi:hypothetical protein